ncbi:MAG: DUF4861 domain-containing protein [Candidatus Marinimicrobia bacterium]|nr:DUF4861 domain-containing protein [Candidatus Neomarinimicrobiota bacterium]
MMKKFKILITATLICLTITGCYSKTNILVKIQNPLGIERLNETIELSAEEINKIAPSFKLEKVRLLDQDGEVIVSQLIDLNKDGNADQLIFQTDLKPDETKIFHLTHGKVISFETKTFARFVPEREDDFAWENDRIAYRMYGKKLELTQNIASGIDVWTKRVRYLVIDKWYKEAEESGEESYHDDHGEGLDFYKVGTSRGCGGLAIWENEKMASSHAYSSWKLIANGPIRSIFELICEPWNVNGHKYSEVKRISIDFGWNLNRIESILECEPNRDEIYFAIGLVIHEKQGEGHVVYDKENRYISFWEPGTKGNGNLGTGIYISPALVLKMIKAESHHLVIASTKPGESVVYYAGAGWDKSGDFPNSNSWNRYIKQMAVRLEHPVEVSLYLK